MMETSIPNLNERQVADFFGLSVKTIQAWRFQGKGPVYHKLNDRTIRYAIDDLKAYAESGKVKLQRG